MARRYRDAAAKLQQNVQKYLQEMDEILSSDEEEPVESSVLDQVLQSYRNRGGDAYTLKKTKILLEETVTGRNVTCLICIGSIKKINPIWTCDHCYSYFHFSCIQKWSKDSISLRSEEGQGPIAVFMPKKIEWCCPKCRHSYTKDEVPQKYRCFCGKLDNPPFHPWLIPHSCGEVCEKRLSTGNYCKHKCLLLCHPGPCPPCPQTVNGVCFCGNEKKNVRCSAAKWSCGQKCNKLLSCKSHKCENICHDGECDPCSYTSIQPCQCAASKVKRPCNDPIWQCEKMCNKNYSCGYHKCEKICHKGECGFCPNSGTRSCPCGANQKYIQCPDIMETCLGTCNKKHIDCDHYCPEKCHKGPCPSCQVLIEKKCQCSSHTRLLPCSREYRCDTKCRGTRACNKHGCGRKCCNGICPPCEKVCDKPLQCGRHKCTMVCHSGPCYPCPLESKVTCRCKNTSIIVPCGREKCTKPPKCSQLCKFKYKCGHTTENSHTCHFGDCPPCKAICDKNYEECEHKCKAQCHEAVAVVFKQVEKPATPWEVKPPTTKIVHLNCPPCETMVSVQCFGEHETVDIPCHQAQRRPCGRSCGRPLPCGNHSCSLLCHLIKSDINYPNVPSACESCNRECLVPRPDKCSHKCSIQSCHPGPCPPCEILERVTCHCGLTEIYLRCKDLVGATEETLSCKQQCPKSLECGHRCKNPCHSGPCRIQVCVKKTKVYCKCGNIKKEFPCNVAKSKEGLVSCDETCEIKKQAIEKEREIEEMKRKQMEEEKNKRELAAYEWKFAKKRKHKEKKLYVNKDNRSFLQKYGLTALSILIVAIAAVYYIVIIF